MNGRKKAFNALAVVVVAFGFWGCDGERPFQSEATYQAPQTGYEITIKATGVVPAGADIAERPSGSVEVRPLGNPQSRKRMILKVKNETHLTYHFDGEDASAMEWDFRTRNAVFADLLTRAGYEMPVADEVEESLEVMYGVMYGPKAMRLKGQTKFLQVTEIKNITP